MGGSLFFLHHLCWMDFAYLPYLVADGEEGNGDDNEDGEDEVEEEPGEVFAEEYVSINYLYRCYDGAGNDNNDYGADSEQAQVIFAEEQDDVSGVCTMNLSQGNLLLTATTFKGNGGIHTCHDAEDGDDDENQAELAHHFNHAHRLEPLLV